MIEPQLTGDGKTGTPADTYLKSTFYEQLVEHVFISEVLQEVRYSFGQTAEVLRSEVDASGYDAGQTRFCPERWPQWTLF